jgi:ribosomal protein L1
VRVCIFTKDPQRAYKDLVASDAFPASLREKVVRVLGVEKLKKRYKSYEQKRALLAEFDVFMVDDRVIKLVAEFLGKTFYQSKAKRPVPIRLTAGAYIDKTAKKDSKESQNVVGTPQGVAKEIETALNSTYLSMSASANTSIRVGTLSMTAQQLAENTSAVVAAIIPKPYTSRAPPRKRFLSGSPTSYGPMSRKSSTSRSRTSVSARARLLSVRGNGKSGKRRCSTMKSSRRRRRSENLRRRRRRRTRKRRASVGRRGRR